MTTSLLFFNSACSSSGISSSFPCALAEIPAFSVRRVLVRNAEGVKPRAENRGFLRVPASIGKIRNVVKYRIDHFDCSCYSGIRQMIISPPTRRITTLSPARRLAAYTACAWPLRQSDLLARCERSDFFCYAHFAPCHLLGVVKVTNNENDQPSQLMFPPAAKMSSSSFVV